MFKRALRQGNKHRKSWFWLHGIASDRRPKRRILLELEELETRALLSAGGLTPDALPPSASSQDMHTLLQVSPMAPPGPGSGYTPLMIQQAYGVNVIPTVKGHAINGAGETIAIVDAYNDPNIIADANYFSSAFGLPVFNSIGGPTLKVVATGGGSVSNLSQDSGWALEESLDVQWAHAIAPKANILVVDAPSESDSDMMNAVAYAAKQKGVAAVSMSWGDYEFSGQTSYDKVLQTPTNHQGVTFVAASGDNSAYYILGGGPIWPSTSANVLAVGGTTLQTSTNINGQTVWSGESGWFGSGGGYSDYENDPTYQANNIGFTDARTTPDVAYNADPNSGYAVYDSVGYGGTSGWMVVGGTSAGAPQWSALVALADQSRHLASGKGTLDNQQVETALYNTLQNATQYNSVFHDITTGSNGWTTGVGYDLVTGLGTPKANSLVPLLAGTSIAAGKVTTVGTNPGGWTGPTGYSTSTGGSTIGSTIGSTTYFGLVTGRGGGGGLYTNQPSFSIVLTGGGDSGGASGIATAPILSVSVTAMTMTAPTSAPTAAATNGINNVLVPFNLSGQGLQTALPGGAFSTTAPTAPTATSATVFGASGWNRSGDAWRLDSFALHGPAADKGASAIAESRQSDGADQPDSEPGEEGTIPEMTIPVIVVDTGGSSG